ncbi:hypothetical protein QE450_003605 [Paenibacillus sp. SORGH_AS306]|uniref:hypothetical protein n=1 Tax=unclassified Paenibacillus TaxID=185978 RepID=UPI002787D087|nr:MULTISPECIES: hypothetical protein [unclassified Paenibacillus]MDQ1236107.1 hypothetical protein [Paenibacillus sp. SORGH_AS_0306]MDR6108462.1 hypothetical protein [Paenibacillus sp. SORGH_AS_0338]
MKYTGGALKAYFADNQALTVLNIGSGSNPIKGAVNIDIEGGKGVDLIADATKALPYADNSINAIIARNPYKYDPVNEFTTAVLKSGGNFIITGTYSNPCFKELYNATLDQLKILGYELLL